MHELPLGVGMGSTWSQLRPLRDQREGLSFSGPLSLSPVPCGESSFDHPHQGSPKQKQVTLQCSVPWKTGHLQSQAAEHTRAAGSL